eukprot:g24655.t1
MYLIRVQEQHVPVRMKDKDDKIQEPWMLDVEKDMVDGNCGDGFVDTLGHIEIEELLAVLRNIEIDKSPGPDGIYSRILKEARGEIVETLPEIFVCFLGIGKVLEDWRIANVVPLFKKDKRENLTNYRHVQKIKLHGIHGELA